MISKCRPISLVFCLCSALTWIHFGTENRYLFGGMLYLNGLKALWLTKTTGISQINPVTCSTAASSCWRKDVRSHSAMACKAPTASSSEVIALGRASFGRSLFHRRCLYYFRIYYTVLHYSILYYTMPY